MFKNGTKKIVSALISAAGFMFLYCGAGSLDYAAEINQCGACKIFFPIMLIGVGLMGAGASLWCHYDKNESDSDEW